MSSATGRAAIDEVRRRLRRAYPDARYELNWENPLQLLVATILAAQATDARVNQVTAGLFQKYRTAQDFVLAQPAELEEAIRPTGYYRNKAKAIQGACRLLLERFGGEVPRTVAELITLPGVARKTANVVLNTAFNIPSGVIVDTHVQRVSQRLGLTTQEKPEKIEQDLMDLVPRDEWTLIGPALVLHGRYTCTAREPRCGDCCLESVCEKHGVGDAVAKADRPAARPTGRPRPPVAKAAPPAGGGVPELPPSWQPVLADELRQPYFQQLQEFLKEERRAHQVFPPPEDVFAALAATPYPDVRVLILGQDPYHDDNQAHGMCFSVRPGVAPPPSLVNIFKELKSDLGCSIPDHGWLAAWARQGVLLLNAVLTVRAHAPNSHKNKGWEKFTDAVLRAVNARADPVVFVLWGGYAQKKAALIDTSRHAIIQSAHPSPLSARNGFFGSKPFSAINRELRRTGQPAIDWQLPVLTGEANPF